MEFWVHDLESSETVGQIFQAQMAALGIQILIKKADFGTAVNKIITGKAPLFSMFIEYVFSAPEPILINMFHSKKVPVPNFFMLKDQGVDTLLDSFYDQAPDNINSQVIKADRAVMDKVPMVPLYQALHIVLYPKDLKPFDVTGNFHIKFQSVRPGRTE